MDPIDESIEVSQEKVQQQQPCDLLENSWFFNNLFKAKKRSPIIPRCYSDPSPCSNNLNQEEINFLGGGKSMEETFSAINKLPDNEKAAGPGRRLSSQKQAAAGGLMRAESAPQRVVRKSSLLQRCSNNNLSRAPSLPVSMAINRDEIQDDESDFSMSRLIRQASLNQSHLLPPRSSPKVVTQSNSTPKQRTRTRTKLDSSESDINTNTNTDTKKSSESSGGIGMRRQQQQQLLHPPQMNRNRTMLGRTSSDMGFQEFRSLRDMGFEKIKEVEPSSSSSKEWPEQSKSSQETEQWVDRRSVEEDMKAQIKFWARAVASNVK